MAVGTGGIDRIDAVDPALEDCGPLVDVFRVGAVGRVEFGGNGEFASPQNTLQPAARGMAGQGIEREMAAKRIFVNMGHAQASFAAAAVASRASAACAVTRSQDEVSRSD